MTTTPRLAPLALAVLALASPASAGERPRLGVGVGVGTLDFNLSMLANDFPAQAPNALYFPINVTSGFRVEPQVGAAVLKQAEGNNPSIETSAVSLGVGLIWLIPVAAQLDAHVGLRVVRTSYRSTLRYDPPRAAQTIEGADLSFSPAVGGEYALHPRFSLGAEAQVQLISFGDRSVSGGGAIPGGSGVSTAGLLFARVYLF
jgi:hypothetical protein